MYHVLTMTRETQTQPQRCADAEIACVLFREEDIKKRDTGLLKGDLNPTRGKPVPGIMGRLLLLCTAPSFSNSAVLVRVLCEWALTVWGGQRCGKKALRR